MGKKWYRSAAQFFEQGDLVPFAVLTSAWHFIQALIKHGEAPLVAIATGIFVDMLHFRTVRKAVDEKNGRAWAVAILTTTISYIFHLLFYVAHIENGVVTYDWTIMAFFMAIPLPVGIPILAWQQATKSDPAVVKFWRKRVKMVIKMARRLENRLKEYEIEMKRHERRVNELETAAARREKEIERLEKRIEELKEAGDILKHFNPLVHDIGRMLAGAEITQDEIAAAHNISAATVSRLKSNLNGANHDH